MKMKTVDQLHISSVGPNTIPPGQEFEVSNQTAEDLEKRGLATRADAPAAPTPANQKAEEKAEEVPQNKMEVAPENKLLSSAARPEPRGTKTPSKRK